MSGSSTSQVSSGLPSPIASGDGGSFDLGGSESASPHSWGRPVTPAPDVAWEQVDAALDDLYLLRNRYFGTDKGERLAQSIATVVDLLPVDLVPAALGVNVGSLDRSFGPISDGHNISVGSMSEDPFPRYSPAVKGRLAYVLGKAYNATEEADALAEAYLTKAVKLDPTNVVAVLCLGEALWKRRALADAQICFQQAVTRSPTNRDALRALSMVLRQVAPRDNPAEFKRALDESLAHANTALDLDRSDGLSWTIVGNARLTMFFEVSQAGSDLQHALTAYETAVATNEADPDLHFNRGTALKYAGRFQEAIAAFERAAELSPGWEAPVAEAERVVAQVARTHDVVTRKGRVKARRLRGLLATLDDAGGSGVAGEATVSTLAGIQAMVIPEFSTLDVVVVATVVSDDPIPFTAVVADREGTFAALHVYNVADEVVKIGMRVTLGDTDVLLDKVSVIHDGQTFEYDVLRVDNPKGMLLNGRPVARDEVAKAELAVDNRAI